MKLPKELTTVTPLSKTLAFVVIVTIPFLGFFFGIKYDQLLTSNNLAMSSLTKNEPQSKLTRYKSVTEQFSVDYPAGWYLWEQNREYTQLLFHDYVWYRVHPKSDKKYLDKIMKTANCITCDYDLAAPPYTDIKEVIISGIKMYTNTDASGDQHIFIVHPLTQHAIEFSSAAPVYKSQLMQLVSSFKFNN